MSRTPSTPPIPGTPGIPEGPDTPDARTLDTLLSTRWSCRGYQDRQVPRETIRQLLSIAQKSASWCNTQPWSVIVTSGEGTERFREAMTEWALSHPGEQSFEFDPPAEYRGVYRERRRACGWQLYESVGIERGDREASARQAFENFRFFGAPHVAVITTDAVQGVYGAVDCGLYINSFLLTARALGLGAIPQAALAGHSALIRKHFALGDDRKVLAGISFGYADEEHPTNTFRTARAGLDEVVTWIDG